jgi:hypothetical protein
MPLLCELVAFHPYWEIAQGVPPRVKGPSVLTPSAKTITLPKCRGCGQPHQIKGRRLYRLAEAAQGSSVHTIFVGDN